MSASSLFRRFLGLPRTAEGPAERAANWLRDHLEAETRARFGWLDAGVWADAITGAPRDSKQAAKRLVDASLTGDEVA